MNTVFDSGNLIKRIRDGKDLNEISSFVRNRIYRNGPVETIILETLSYLKLFQPDYFKKFENEIIETMGLYFKSPEPESLQGVVFDMYRQYIHETYGENYTPMQASILKQVSETKQFSFSAPTSTGKSFVFRNLIKSAINDVVVIVPSRALINEYYDKIRELVDIKLVNVLTFVEHINTKHVNRNIFILTPERARELFKNKSWLNIELILFDEAQLSDEESIRGLYFDSIVRRSLKIFENAKFIFAHPFISNPEAQLERNDVVNTVSTAHSYEQKNVGQIFYVHNVSKDIFYHLGSDKDVLGKQKLITDFDPIEKAIQDGGSVLIYVPKSHIYDKSIYTQFDKYIKMCSPIQSSEANNMINTLRGYIGASFNEPLFCNSEMLEKLSCGIVIHHGSMPLTARLILEHFTQRGYCRICFATSTLEQGINMPFDVVYLDRFEASKSLSVKNLIGRAGRSTQEKKFDFGSVIIRENAKTELRKVLQKQEVISAISSLDTLDDSVDKKYNEFKDAIKNDKYSDEYNLTELDLQILSSDDVIADIPALLDIFFVNNKLIKPESDMGAVYEIFQELYKIYLRRDLTKAEKAVVSMAIKIMVWKVYGKTFRNICQYRYAYVSKINERRRLIKEGKQSEAESITVKYLQGYHDIPDKKLAAYPLISADAKAKDVDYDLVVYDTYDYLDKLIGFKLSDIYYAIFHKYYLSTDDNRALKLANYFKYGTDNNKEIWMLRYGLTFEDIEWASSYIEKIDENEILFNDKVNELDNDKLNIIKQYIY
ncbi:MAG: DEAD/DEAH box helicase [Candidatus Fimivivens sp.]